MRHWLGPGNTNVRRLGSTPPMYPPGTALPYHPGYPPPVPHVTAARVHRCRGDPGTCTYDTFEVAVGDPRGRIRTPQIQVHAAAAARPTLRSPRSPWARLWAAVGLLPGSQACCSPDILIFSVFLSISQYFRYLSILQYSSVYLSYISVILKIVLSPPGEPCPALRSGSSMMREAGWGSRLQHHACGTL